MPKRQRPKSQFREVSAHTRLRRRWRKWLPEIKRDLQDLLGRQEIFWELQDIAKENAAILSPGSFFDWMCRSHMIAMSVGVRTHVDFDKRSHSLARMLYEMLERPRVITREWHVRMYRNAPIGEELGHMSFNSSVGRGKSFLPQGVIRADLRRIEDASERIRRFVNKRIAHRANRGAIRRAPRLNELDSALRTLDEVFCKYNLLLTAEGSSSVRATRQYDWREVLWSAWIPKGGEVSNEAQPFVREDATPASRLRAPQLKRWPIGN
ncbi:MAG: hypothetical protein EPN55_09555 [Gammaproteobacteria bacterium]|nr:MAG: hypothetical protein EPN55_09555 [Gammaproteobacteria bacterium]